MGVQVCCTKQWILVLSTEITRRRRVQSKVVVVELWEFIHLATCMAVGIPGNAYLSQARMTSMTWAMGMAPQRKGNQPIGCSSG